MKKNKATRYFHAHAMGNLSRLVNIREAMANPNGDSFRYGRLFEEVDTVHDLDFDNRYCFIMNSSGRIIEVDSLEEAQKLFSNI